MCVCVLAMVDQTCLPYFHNMIILTVVVQRNEIIYEKLSLSRIIRVQIMNLSVVKIFSEILKLLYTDSRQPY